MRRSIASCLPLVALLAVASAGMAAVMAQLAPGATVALGGTTYAEDPSLAGTIEDEAALHFACGDQDGELKGTLQARVVRNKAGTLDFYYRVINDPASELSIGILGALREPQPMPWLNGAVLVEYRLDGVGDVGPTTAHRSSDGRDIDFVFEEGIAPGDASLFLLVRPSAQGYAADGEVDVTDGVRTCSVGEVFHPI
jgi:hypothetical protein